MDFGSRDKVHVPVDSRQAEHVLVFQVASVAPFVDLDSQCVASLREVPRDVKLRVVVRPLAVTHLLSVDPDVKSGVHSVEMEKNLFASPFAREGEIPAIGSHWIGLSEGRVALLRLDERRIVKEWIGAVGIQRGTVAFHLPGRRHFDLIPGRHIVLW